MALNVSHLPETVAVALRQYARRKRLYAVAHALAAGCCVYAGLALIVMHVDRFSFLAAGVRTLLSHATHLTGAMVTLVLLTVALARKFTGRNIAYEMENRLAGADDEQLTTIAQVWPQAGDETVEVRADLLRQLGNMAEQVASGKHAGGLVRDFRLARTAACLVFFMLLFFMLSLPAAYQFPLMVERFLFPGRNLPKPSFVRITVMPENIVIGKGDELIVQARIEGQIPRPLAWLMARVGTTLRECLVVRAPGVVGPLPWHPDTAEKMTRVDRQLFILTMSDLQTAQRFRIRHADAQTAAIPVDVVTQPCITGLVVDVVSPPYARLADQTYTNHAGSISVLRDSKVTIRFATDQPVTRRLIRIGDGDEPVEPGWDGTNLIGCWTFDFEDSTLIEIMVENERGFANVDPTRISFELREDVAPRISMEEPGGETSVVPGGLVAVRALIEDDLAIVQASFQYMLNPESAQDVQIKDVPVEIEQGDTNVKRLELSTGFDIEKTGATPGDDLLLQMRVRDSAGNDTVSSPVIIHVVAFTRGENERRRLAAMTIIRSALTVLQEQRASADTATELDADKWQTLTTMADAHGLSLPESPLVSSLLRFIELEHHFTDRPHDKEAVRMLHGVVAAASIDSLQMASNGITVVSNCLRGLTQYRRLRNVVTRLYGMRYEADSIAARLQKMATSESPDPEQKLVIRRRARVYLDVLQDIGDELAELSRETGVLSTDDILNIQADLNTDAYYLKRGSTKKNLESIEAIRARLEAMILLVIPAMPQLAVEYERARQVLSDRYAMLYNRAADVVLADEWNGAPGPRQWLSIQDRMLERNPFVSMRDRMALFLLSAAADADSKDRAATCTLARELHAPSGPLSEAAGVESGHMAELARIFEWQAMLARDDACGGEKTCYMLLEKHACADATNFTSTATARLAGLNVIDGDLSVLAEKVVVPSTGAMSFRAAADAFGRAVVAGSVLPVPPAAVTLTSARLAQVQSVLGRATKSFRETQVDGEPGSLPSDITAEQLRRMNSAVGFPASALAMRLRYQPEHGTNVAAGEALLQDLKETCLRFDAMSNPLITTLSAGSTGAGGSGRMDAALSQASVAADGAASRLSAMQEQWAAGHYARKSVQQGYATLDAWVLSRDLLLATDAMMERGSDEVGREFLVKHPDVAGDYLGVAQAPVRRLVRCLDDACAMLGSDEPDILGAYADKLAEATSIADRLLVLVAASGENEYSQATLPMVKSLARALVSLRIGKKNSSRVIIRKKLYKLAQTRKIALRLERRLRHATRSSEMPATAFRGGPAGLWDPARGLRVDAASSRRRVIAQVRAARREGVLRLMEGSQEAHVWAAFLHRLVRSELAGAPRRRAREQVTEKGKQQFIDWLMSELDAAATAVATGQDSSSPYGPVTREYLDAVKDYLRY